MTNLHVHEMGCGPSSGAVVEPDGEVKVYYGAADTVICVASAPLGELIDVARQGS